MWYELAGFIKHVCVCILTCVKIEQDAKEKEKFLSVVCSDLNINTLIHYQYDKTDTKECELRMMYRNMQTGAAHACWPCDVSWLQRHLATVSVLIRSAKQSKQWNMQQQRDSQQEAAGSPAVSTLTFWDSWDSPDSKQTDSSPSSRDLLLEHSAS